MSGTRHCAPDGRFFRVYIGRCLCSPCWCARCCQCGEKLTAHDFSKGEAIAGALSVMTTEDSRPGFGHQRCS